MDRPSRHLSLGIIVLLVLVLAGCGDDSDGDQETGAPTTTQGEVATTTTESVPGTTTGDRSGEEDPPATTTTPSDPTTTTTASTTPTTSPPATADPGGDSGQDRHPDPDRQDCTETQDWGTGPQESGVMGTDAFYLVRAGRHPCFERVVFDINGVSPGADVTGYHVSYVSGDVRADGSGEPVPTAGDAALEVIIRAPIRGSAGHQPWREPPRLGDDYFTPDELQGWTSLRQITYAGSFEGQTTVAVGLDAERPFRVGAFERQGSTHIYVDIAHDR